MTGIPGAGGGLMGELLGTAEIGDGGVSKGDATGVAEDDATGVALRSARLGTDGGTEV